MSQFSSCFISTLCDYNGIDLNIYINQKNAHGKIIILYDDDERMASQAATTMCERGFENLFMLSGGRLSRGTSARDAKATTVRSSQNLPAANSTMALTTRSLSSSSLQSKPWR
ncbi:hypothetical protein JD844_029016 [Phrynosoma platyrhinos]|uniref:Rhodanese domain-containing protein n=1 Tax=Phrynosoma platyrhinos TaxID=52577 RepID=A0ABQ7SIQ4_PHRPL|nr:hypothetical protein JD844_029016 [Phrynosoma platyrhinos]